MRREYSQCPFSAIKKAALLRAAFGYAKLSPEFMGIVTGSQTLGTYGSVGLFTG